MGACCSSESAVNPYKTSAAGPSRTYAPDEVRLYEVQRPDGTFDSVPDPGLDEQYEFVRMLGYGGTGQTLLYRNRKTEELVATKLIKRPIPELLQKTLLREITVSFHSQ